MLVSSSSTLGRYNRLFLNIIAFLMAFCSLSYELIIAARLSRLVGAGMFLYPACIGIFILFMGIGSCIWYRTSESIEGVSLRYLINLEMWLTLFGLICVLGINLNLDGALYSINLEALAFGVLMAAVIGFLSGQELPLLFHFCSYLQMGQVQIRRIIFYDYLSSFFASLVCSLIFFPFIGFLKASISVAFVNCVIVVLLLILARLNSFVCSRRTYLLLFVFLWVFFLFFCRLDLWENKILKRMYLGSRAAVLLAKQYTAYQQVLVFAMRKDAKRISSSAADMLRHPQDYYLLAVLNGSLQFFEPLSCDSDPDHHWLFDPYLSYLRSLHNIHRVLILGGGDGLPARELVHYPFVKAITMVDIDKQWVRFSAKNPFMSMLNEGALNNCRLNIYFMDAFKWVLRTKEKFDFVAVDFPSEPVSLARIRTHSIQFFRDLRRILNDDGIVVIHSNSKSSFLKLSLIAKSASVARLYRLFGYRHGNRRWTQIEHIVLFKSAASRCAYIQYYSDRYVTEQICRKNIKGKYLTIKDAKGLSALLEGGNGNSKSQSFYPNLRRRPAFIFSKTRYKRHVLSLGYSGVSGYLYRYRQANRCLRYMQYFLIQDGEYWISFYDPLVSKLPDYKQLQLMKSLW